jgi:hypothetical protein
LIIAPTNKVGRAVRRPYQPKGMTMNGNNMIEHAEVALRLFKSADSDKKRCKESLQRYHRILLKSGADQSSPVFVELQETLEQLKFS